ncbi:MAG: hypothetical protein CMP67_08010 [Flavobacteriales bacterium]|nr:hypothetical protein [Flavobacteriales bacterium]|tara:strand:- start:1776 stop:2726 length:951 start_codon:yes stop_codon:yes gene_type:complete
MSLSHLKSWPLNKKIVASITLLVFSILLFNGLYSLIIHGDLKALESGSVGDKVTQLAQQKLDAKIDDFSFFKEIQKLIQEVDSKILNKGFYIQIGYNLIVFFGLSILFMKFFQVDELKSLNFRNKSVVLLLVVLVLAINVPSIGIDATSMLESILGESSLDDKKNLISQFILFLPNAERGWIVTLIGIALIPAIGEELMFRGFLMNLLAQKSNHHNGIAVSALIFAVVHFNFTNFFFYFILGVVMGYVYYWGRNLIFPIIIHFVNNALVLFGYMYAISIEAPEEFSQSYFFMPYIITGLSLLIFYLNFKRNENLLH